MEFNIDSNNNDGFTDPVLRCDSCQALLLLKTLHKFGRCNKCGNKRLRNVTVFNEKEKDLMESWELYDFLAAFEAVSDE